MPRERRVWNIDRTRLIDVSGATCRIDEPEPGVFVLVAVTRDGSFPILQTTDVEYAASQALGIFR